MTIGAGAISWIVEGGVSPDAACLDGHFPGNPVVPGAVLVGYAVMGLAARGVTVRGLRRAKFLRPLPPGVDFEVEANRTASGATIRWSADGQTVAQASASIDWPDG